MTVEEMLKVVDAFCHVSDHIERASGLRRLVELFPDFKATVIDTAAKFESPDDPDWYAKQLE